MVTKITLYAKNIAVATNLLQYAIAEGCAIEEMVQTDPPIVTNGKTRRQQKQGTAHGRGGNRGTVYALKKGVRTSGLRAEAYTHLLKAGPTEGKPIDFITSLKDAGWQGPQARSAVHGLQKAKALQASN